MDRVGRLDKPRCCNDCENWKLCHRSRAVYESCERRNLKDLDDVPTPRPKWTRRVWVNGKRVR